MHEGAGAAKPGGGGKRGRRPRVRAAVPGERCEICGKAGRDLQRSECCGHRFCVWGDFSLSRQCCYVRHSRFTLCGSHHSERHAGDWKTCQRCRRGFETEMYVYYGTNEYNVEKLDNPPAYRPTHCRGCGRVIVLGRDGHCIHPDGSYECDDCFED